MKPLYFSGKLTNELLIESYVKAIELKLDHDFVELLVHELETRNLDDSLPHVKLKS